MFFEGGITVRSGQDALTIVILNYGWFGPRILVTQLSVIDFTSVSIIYFNNTSIFLAFWSLYELRTWFSLCFLIFGNFSSLFMGGNICRQNGWRHPKQVWQQISCNLRTEVYFLDSRRKQHIQDRGYTWSSWTVQTTIPSSQITKAICWPPTNLNRQI